MSARPAPVLVLAVGNPSRGDDALGPELASRIEAAGWPGVEVIIEFQLQVEHALDLEGRERVLFIDAGTGTTAPYELRKSVPFTKFQSIGDSVNGTDFLYTTHALPPDAVLATYQRIKGEQPPEAWVLCVRGERFELGESLTPEAARNLEAAWHAVRGWLEAE